MYPKFSDFVFNVVIQRVEKQFSLRNTAEGVTSRAFIAANLWKHWAIILKARIFESVAFSVYSQNLVHVYGLWRF